MTSHASPLSIAPASITRRLNRAGAPVLFSRVRVAGAVTEVVCENDDDARACSAVLLQAGYDTAARKGYGQLDVTLPVEEPVEEPVEVTVEPAAEPVQVAHLMGEDLLAACGSHGDALGLYVIPSSTPERITCPACRELLQTPEEVADAILDRRPILDLFPAGDLTREQAETIDAGVTLATERLTEQAAPRALTDEAIAPTVEALVAEALAVEATPRAVRRVLEAAGVRRGAVAVHDSPNLPATIVVRVLNPRAIRTGDDAHAALADAGYAVELPPGAPGLYLVRQPEALAVDDDPREQPAPLEWSQIAVPSEAYPRLPRALRYPLAPRP